MKANRVSARAPAALLPILLLASCAGPMIPPAARPPERQTPPPRPQPPRQPAPSPSPAPTPAPTRAPTIPPRETTRPGVSHSADWRDAPQTPGAWRWSNSGGRSSAAYGLPGQAPQVELSCTLASRTMNLWTTGSLDGPAPLAVTTTSARRLLTALPEARGGASVRLSPTDPLLDAMAFSRGRFMLERAGFPAFYLPAWPELSRVIEDCR